MLFDSVHIDLYKQQILSTVFLSFSAEKFSVTTKNGGGLFGGNPRVGDVILFKCTLTHHRALKPLTAWTIYLPKLRAVRSLTRFRL